MLNAHPILPAFGVDVAGVDLASLTAAQFAALYDLWIEYGVLRVRDQELDQEQLQAFSARFGPLEEIPFGRMSEADKAKVPNRYVTVISNIIENGKPIGGLGSAEATWHSDMTYIETPPPASVLLGVEVPTRSGDTYFADQYAAYAALPDDLKARVAKLSIKHNAAHTSVGKLRPGFEAFEDPREAPGAVHPIVKTHDESGRRCLYLGRREWAYIPGLTLEESEALLDAIWAYAALPENVLHQEWRVGDVVIWDNRCVLHRRDAIEAEQRRLMHRCQVMSANTG
ncbi:MAG: TauD/TfdA family dioxygenase [Pseudomonadota bacterium]